MEKRIRELFSTEILHAALDCFNVSKADCEELDGFESYVYKVTNVQGKFILKISHSSRRSQAMIQGEAAFINYLQQHGLTIPGVIPSAHNRLMETIPAKEGYFTAVLYGYAPGTFVSKSDWTPAMFAAMGAYLGKLHAISKIYTPNDTSRPSVIEESVPFLRQFIPQQDVIIRDKVERLIAHLHTLPQDANSYGLIHVDFHRGNFFVDQGQIYLFDFDDCQHSWFIHDIAMAFFYAIPHDCSSAQAIEDGHEFMRHFLDGYRRHFPLDVGWLNEIPQFLKLRELELYALIHRSCDLNNLDAWTTSFMTRRKEKLEQDIPYFALDVERLATLP